ncbi:hypothetical protein [Thalassobellus suaedae]|uniref:Uncharacterized protein n=1 Tax=Thalassobellus suaedae TaxID=3074124 RepID=A0ABY9XVX9_9FLAO|nr:hypothetical protein RHP51_05050 [Flavobacteriaceae bacterium HL-DH14]
MVLWSEINEHEYRAWFKEDHEYMMDLSNRLVKRVLLSQILLELDDSLEPDFEDNKYFKNVLEKSKKQCERLANDQFDRLYGIDETYVTNFTNTIDNVATLCTKLGLQDYVHLSKLLEDYAANPEKYQKDTVEFIKLDS